MLVDPAGGSEETRPLRWPRETLCRGVHDQPTARRGGRSGGARPLGISMLLSSGLSELWWRCCPGSVFAEQRPKDVDAAAGEGDDGLAVSAAVGSFLEVVVAVRAGSHHAGLRREVADVPERAAIAQRAVQVAGAPTRVVRDGHESGCCSKVASVGKCTQVAGTD